VHGEAAHSKAVGDLLGHRGSTLPAEAAAPERPVQRIGCL
jgi:hypothetical protein